LGDGTITDRSTPTLVIGENNVNIKNVFAGDHTSILLNKLGKVFLFGKNNVGQMGIGSTGDIFTPMEILTQNYDIVEVCSGDDHTIILKGLNFIILIKFFKKMEWFTVLEKMQMVD
jgi:alpha-tubulin suppressor-like RCC1 family protein